MSSIRGPVNPSLNYECGLLIEGFATPPFFMMTHNRPYYADLIEANGFKKIEDLYAFWGEMSMLEGIDSKLGVMVEGVKERFGVSVRSLDRSRFTDEVRMFLDIYNTSLAGTWGFVPLSQGRGESHGCSFEAPDRPRTFFGSRSRWQAHRYCFLFARLQPAY